MKQRWPELEQGILKNLGGWTPQGHAEWAYLYARHIIKGPWPYAEKKSERSLDFAHIYKTELEQPVPDFEKELQN